MKVCFFTLGCKVNQQETAAMINILKKLAMKWYTVKKPQMYMW